MGRSTEIIQIIRLLRRQTTVCAHRTEASTQTINKSRTMFGKDRPRMAPSSAQVQTEQHVRPLVKVKDGSICIYIPMTLTLPGTCALV